MLPAPRTFATQVMRRLDACSPPARRLVEAAAVLGANATLESTAAIAEVPDLIDALDEAAAVNLLKVPDDSAGIRGIMFSHPLVQAAVYGQLGPARRVQLHSAAAGLVEDPAAVLRHRVMATTPPDPSLAAELEAFARRKAGVGAWAGAAWALVEASRLSSDREQRERRLLKAVDAMIGAGDLIQADAFAQEVAGFAPAAMGDATMGYLAVLRGRPGDAEKLLRAAWKYCDNTGDATLGTAVAQRLALHGVGRLRGDEVVRWSRRAVELAVADDPVRVEAEALLGLGLGWQGNVPEGLAAYESILAQLSSQEDGPPEDRVRMAYGWLRLVTDDVVGARTMLAQTAAAALQAGSVRIAVWAFVWSAHAGFAVGAWDEAAADADRAVSLLEETGHEWLRPLARCAAVLVPAARGEWTTAEEHARAAAARPGDYELMVVAAALAQAHLAAARSDHDAVLRALEPVLLITPRDGVDEPGFWPWQGLYADALVNAGRLTEADEFLRPHEDLAAARRRGSTVARLARVRGKLEAAQGHLAAAEDGVPARTDRDRAPAHAVPAGPAGTRLRPGAAPRGATPRSGPPTTSSPRPIRRAAGPPLPRTLRTRTRRLRTGPRQTQRLRPQPADRARISRRPTRRPRHGQPTSGLRTLRQHQNRPIPPHPHLRQTRHQHPRRTRRPIPRQRQQRRSSPEGPPGGRVSSQPRNGPARRRPDTRRPSATAQRHPDRRSAKSVRSSSIEMASPAVNPQKAAPMLRTLMSETVTTKVTSAPSVNRELNAATNDDCSTRSIARPPRTAMKAAGVASINWVNRGAKSPNRTASRPQQIPAM